MYVVSSLPPHRQSIAGSLFQTITRLCTAIGFGIATAIYNAVANNPSKSGYYANNPAELYAAAFWFSMGVAVLGVFLVPFLKIGTQGHEKHEDPVHEEGRNKEEEAAEEKTKGAEEVVREQSRAENEADAKKTKEDMV